MATILFATDGSEYARDAARKAIDMAKERDATLHVICVVDNQRFNEPGLSTSELATIYAEDHATVSVAEVTDMAGQSAVTVEGDTRHGVPHEVILEYAEEIDADAILVGEHGDHERHFSGVGKKVTELADREVIVVKANS